MKTCHTVWVVALLSGWLLPWSVSAVDPSLSIQQYNQRTWQRTHGFPANAVNDMAVDDTGLLWLATSQGLMNFDGVEFRLADAREHPQIHHKVMMALAPRSDGGVWFGLANGVYGYFDEGRFHEVEQPPSLNNGFVHALGESPDGDLLIATQVAAIGAHRDGKFTSLALGRSIDFTALHVDHHGREWLGTAADGLFRREGDALVPVSLEGLPNVMIQDIVVDRSDSLWIATATGLQCYDAELRPVPVEPMPAQPMVMLVDSHGVLWVGTSGGGLLRMEADGNYRRYREPDGLAGNRVLSLVETPDGSLWVGTSDGLTQLSDVKFPIYSESEGMVSSGSLAVAAADDGALWVGTANGLSVYRDGVFTNYGHGGADGVGSHWIKRIIPDGEGGAYLIGAQKNLDHFSNGRTVESWKFDRWPRDVVVDEHGVILALAGDLMRLEDGAFVPYRLKDGSPVSLAWIHRMEVARDGSLWIASVSGLHRIREGVLSDVYALGGLESAQHHFLVEDDQGAIWAARKEGITRYHDGSLSVFTSEHGLYEDFVYAIVPDANGSIWMDSNRGIFSVPKEAFDAVASGQKSRFASTVYRGSHAVKSNDKLSQDEFTGARTTDGRIWFPTSKGIIMIDPDAIPQNLRPPTVSIERMRVNGQPYDLVGMPAIDPGPGHLEFDYAAVDYQAPEQLTYRYWLRGFDEGWVEAASRRSAFYTNLPPGDYRFEVQARNADGVWSETARTALLKLPPRLHETLAFRLGIAGLLLAFGAYLTWVWGLYRRQAVMESQVRERTAELGDANEALRAEVEERKRAQTEAERLRVEAEQAVRAKSRFLANMSHEIRTPLNGVLGMTNLLLDTPLDDQQREFAETTRNSAEALLTVIHDVLDFSKIEAGKLKFEQLAFDLREVVEESAELLSLRAAERGVEVAAFIDTQLPDYWRGDAGRLRQVLLNLIGNAVKFTDSGEITVRVSQEEDGAGDQLRFEVVDTGIGIPETVRETLFHPFVQADSSTTRRYGGTGLGLAISRQIIELMGGRIGVESSVGEGSRFWFTMPLEPVSGDAPVRSTLSSAAPLRGLRLLAVETGPTALRVLQHHADAWGVRIEEADTATQAEGLLRAAQRQGDPFHFAIGSFGGSADDSRERIRSLVEASGQSGFGVILLSSAQHWVALRADPRGAVATVRKPVREASFLDACLQAIGRGSGLARPGDPAVADAGLPVDGEHRPEPEDMRILVVEDHAVNQRVIRLLLKKYGYHAGLAANGYEALEALVLSDYDVIFMDCHMPELDGYETTRRIRRNDACAQPYIIAMTANTMEGDREKCLACGMDDYVPKPAREDDLLAALRRAAARRDLSGADEPSPESDSAEAH